MTRHCWKCGTPWTLSGLPGRSESCPQCQSDLRVCLNCVSYDPHVAQQCRDRRADPEPQKAVGTFCEYFDFVKRRFTPPELDARREDAARSALKRLLGD